MGVEQAEWRERTAAGWRSESAGKSPPLPACPRLWHRNPEAAPPPPVQLLPTLAAQDHSFQSLTAELLRAQPSSALLGLCTWRSLGCRGLEHSSYVSFKTEVTSSAQDLSLPLFSYWYNR